MCVFFSPSQCTCNIHVTCIILLFSPDGLTEFHSVLMASLNFLFMRLHLMWHASVLIMLHVIWSDSVVTRVMLLTQHCYCIFSAVCCWGADGAAWSGVPPRQHAAHDVLWSHRECSCQHTARWSRQHLKDVKLGPQYSEDGHGQMTLSQTEKFCCGEELWF